MARFLLNHILENSNLLKVVCVCSPVGYKKHEKNNILGTKEFSFPCHKMAVLSAVSTVACVCAATNL